MMYQEDEFVRLQATNKNDYPIITYVTNGIFFVANCIRVQSIELDTNVQTCFKDIPVKVEINDKIYNYFLTKNNIIRQVSRIVNCANYNRVISVEDLVFYQNGTKINDITKSYKKAKLKSLIGDFMSVDSNLTHGFYNHLDVLTNKFDTANAFMNVFKITESNGKYMYKKYAHNNDISLIKNDYYWLKIVMKCLFGVVVTPFSFTGFYYFFKFAAPFLMRMLKYCNCRFCCCCTTFLNCFVKKDQTQFSRRNSSENIEMERNLRLTSATANLSTHNDKCREDEDSYVSE